MMMKNKLHSLLTCVFAFLLEMALTVEQLPEYSRALYYTITKGVYNVTKPPIYKMMDYVLLHEFPNRYIFDESVEIEGVDTFERVGSAQFYKKNISSKLMSKNMRMRYYFLNWFTVTFSFSLYVQIMLSDDSLKFNDMLIINERVSNIVGFGLFNPLICWFMSSIIDLFKFTYVGKTFQKYLPKIDPEQYGITLTEIRQ